MCLKPRKSNQVELSKCQNKLFQHSDAEADLNVLVPPFQNDLPLEQNVSDSKAENNIFKLIFAL